MTTEPRWLTRARGYIGVRETPGAANNSTIIGWAKKLGGWVASWYRADSTAWCGLYVGMVMAAEGLPLPKNPLGALQWSTWGVPLQKLAPGAIVTFTRKGGGHVGFAVRESADAIEVLGGNQADSVNLTWIAKSRLHAIRWPAGEPLPTTPIPFVDRRAGKLSTNEA